MIPSFPAGCERMVLTIAGWPTLASDIMRILLVQSVLSCERARKPELPERSRPKEAPLYAQNYLDQRWQLQPNRPEDRRAG